MKLINLGDHIDKGFYKVHSTFKNVVNLFNDNSFITIATSDKPSGPFNIIVDDFNSDVIDYIEVTNSNINTKVFSFNIDNEKRWSSVYIFQEIDLTVLLFKINTIIYTLKGLLNVNSLLFVQNNSQTNLKGFEKELYISLKKGINTLFEDGSLNGIPLIKGKGKGLTPSGDDFITGYLYALFVWEQITNIDTSVLRKNVFELSRSSNIIVDYQLKAACNGWFNSSFIHVLDFLFKNINSEVQQAVNPLLSCGSTSGEDILSGFLLTMKNLLIKQNLN